MKIKKLKARVEYVFKTGTCKVSEIRKKDAHGHENPAVRGIFENFLAWGLEEAKRFDFIEETIAGRFRNLCYKYIERHALSAVAKRVGNTVYVYKVEQEAK